MIYGAKILAGTALELIEDPELLKTGERGIQEKSGKREFRKFKSKTDTIRHTGRTKTAGT